MADLTSVKAGDMVLMTSNNAMLVCRVKKVHKLHIELENGSKFKIRGGSLVGGSTWSQSYIDVYDDAMWKSYQARLRFKRMRDILYKIEWRNVDNAIVEQVYALVKK